jgi:hypothetical protein
MRQQVLRNQAELCQRIISSINPLPLTYIFLFPLLIAGNSITPECVKKFHTDLFFSGIPKF